MRSLILTLILTLLPISVTMRASEIDTTDTKYHRSSFDKWMRMKDDSLYHPAFPVDTSISQTYNFRKVEVVDTTKQVTLFSYSKSSGYTNTSRMERYSHGFNSDDSIRENFVKYIKVDSVFVVEVIDTAIIFISTTGDTCNSDSCWGGEL